MLSCPDHYASSRRSCSTRCLGLGLTGLLLIVGQISPPAAAAVSDGTAQATVKNRRHEIGETTHQLLELQASGRAGAPVQPMTGDEAAASYKRFIDSFSHPIPEYFQTMVGQRAGGSGSGSGGGR